MTFASRRLVPAAASVFILASPAIAQSNFEKCVFATMVGPIYKQLEVNKHEFNCMKMNRFALTDGRVHFSGILSHHKTGWTDDQVGFRFIVKDGKLDGRVEIELAETGWSALAGSVVAIIGAVVGVPIPPDKASSVFSQLENIKGDDWTLVASAIVGAVAAQAAAVEGLPPGQQIRHASSGKYLDAYQHATGGFLNVDFNVVMRNSQGNNSQRWVLVPVAGAADTFHVIQRSTGRFLDAYQTNGVRDYKLVTRLAQDNNTQKWGLTAAPGGRYTFKQLSSGRYIDAYTSESNDFQVVTRPAQDNDTQRWLATIPAP
jgi:hypothetical protein